MLSPVVVVVLVGQLLVESGFVFGTRKDLSTLIS
jgi:hypothetical protein